MGDAVQLLINSLIAGTQYGLVALSFALIYATARFFHFTHGAIYTVSAYAAFSLLTSARANPPAAIAAAIVIAATLGGLIELGVYSRLRKRRSSSIILLLASLGILIVLQNLISLQYGDATKAMPGSIAHVGVRIAGGNITPVQLYTIGLGVLIWLGVHLSLRHTRAGKTLRAVASDPELATIVGINSAFTILGAFAVGSMIVGIAAILAAYDVGIKPTMGFNALLFGIVAMIVGGVGNIPASFWGGMIIGLLQQVAGWMLPSKWQDTVVFLTLIVFLVCRPQGLVGKRLRKITF